MITSNFASTKFVYNLPHSNLASTRVSVVKYLISIGYAQI